MNANIRIDLYSDTKTRPSAAMRQAMVLADVGDEQADEDPTTNVLQERVAKLLGKEAALFTPSGTMCNQIALAVHCRPGEELIADKTSHIVNSESGGLAAIAGAQVRTMDGARGVFTAEQLRDALRIPARMAPVQRLVSIEQTANLAGGTIWPMATLNEVGEVARAAGLTMHMDGARLLNASVESGIAAASYAAPFDSVWIDLSKGLGCPVGGVLAGSAKFISEAARVKQRLGGAMRQSGMLAAAGIYALDNNVARLAEDHANAREFARILAQVQSVVIDADAVDTNIVIFDVAETGWTAPDFARELLKEGIRVSVIGPTLLRAVTHLDVTRAQVVEAAETTAAAIRRPR